MKLQFYSSSRGRAALTLFVSFFVTLACGRAAADLSDVNSDAILKIAPNGTQSTFSTVTTPRSLAFGTAGNLYVADGTSQSIIKITSSGLQSTFATGLSDPRALAFALPRRADEVGLPRRRSAGGPLKQGNQREVGG